MTTPDQEHELELLEAEPQTTTSLKPSPKIAAGFGGGSLAVLITWAAKEYGGVDLPPDVAAAFTTLVVSLVAWITSD